MTEEFPRLEVFENQSVLHHSKGDAEVFAEGPMSEAAQLRLSRFREIMSSGYLEDVLAKAQDPAVELSSLEDSDRNHIQSLVESVTSERGRALVGLTVLQLAIKSIVPDQSVRLHKAGRGDFSWSEGFPMRPLDTTFVTPFLRRHDLMRLNADGFMMTRSLAENYPYSTVYKASLRGAKSEWIEIVNRVESGEIESPEQALIFVLSQLLSRSARFVESVRRCTEALENSIGAITSVESVLKFINGYISESEYSARLLEIACHSFAYSLLHIGDHQVHLVPLSQMRSANKKHGNVGDIEFSTDPSGDPVIEAWDAKYGKPYLRDELEELHDKLESRSAVQVAGFITDSPPNLKSEITNRMDEIHEDTGCKVSILTLGEWVELMISRFGMTDVELLSRLWLTTFVDYLSLRLEEVAPIQEPTEAWLRELTVALAVLKAT